MSDRDGRIRTRCFAAGTAFLLAIMLSFFLCATRLLAASAPAGDGTSKELKISRILPSGEDAPTSRQIVFEFNRPVVPLGRMERNASEIPIEIEPALACQWRWLNSSSLACQLDERNAMAPATRYTIKVRPEIKTEDGAALAGPVSHSFVTKRPKSASVMFQRYLAPGMPLFRIEFNQPVQRSTLESHLFFKTDAGPRVAAKATEDKRFEKKYPGLVWMVTPASDLPDDTGAGLYAEPGILGVKGTEPGIQREKVASFHTLPQFRFEGVECRDMNNKQLIFRPESPFSPKVRCNPIHVMYLRFSSPVANSELRQKVRLVPAGKGGDVQDVWEEGDYSRLTMERSKGEAYSFMMNSDALAPFTEYRIIAKANTIKDEFGRALTKNIDMRFATDHRPPDLHIFKNMFVLEKGLDTDMPVVSTNLDQIELKYEVLGPEGKSAPQSKVLTGPRKRDAAVSIPLQIRKLLGRDSGSVMGSLSTRPAVREKEYQPNWFFAEVTPYHVHVKMGHFSSLVWITDLQTGKPVEGVSVRIQSDTFKNLGQNPTILTEGLTDASGIAQLDGTAKIDPNLKSFEGIKRDSPTLFVSCRKDGDIGVVPLRYEFQVDSEGSNHQYIPSSQQMRHGHVRAWGATAQGIYKVGDTVQYKIYVRDQENRRFIQPPASTYRLKVLDPSSRVIHQRDKITLSEFGACDGEFIVPKNGAVGVYRFTMEADFAKLDLDPLQVLVSDFTPSPFRAVTELNGNLFGIGDSVTVTTQAKLHAGGPYGNAPTRINAWVETQPFRTTDAAARSFQFDVYQKDEDEPSGTQNAFQTSAKLDNDGNMETKFTLADLPVQYGRLTVESSVSDERAKSVASRATAVFYGRDRYVGLLQPDWVFQEGKPVKTSFVVVDQNGKIIPGVATHVDIEKLETKAARVKEAGDAYATQYSREWVKVQGFDLSSGADPQEFEFAPAESGTLRIVAEIRDTKGRTHKTVLRRWVSGRSYVLWESDEGNLLNVHPEKETYKVGDTARFFVQNPYPGAQALVTVERYGVLDRWVRTLEGSAEVIEIPVQPDYIPGFYVSVMVMSPRVDKPLGPGGEDLGKPTFRIGYAKIEVQDVFKLIDVKCVSDKEVYKPRETVKLEFEASPRNLPSDVKNPPIELAVAVLDEAVFDLLSQKALAFDPYQGFYKLDSLDLTNFNIIMQLVGREKLEKKGASPAAAAGFDLSMRSVFKFVSYWNPSLRTDADGKVKVEFTLPDNLTGWRVLAMAVTPEDRMGLGQYTFKANQLTELRPVLPNQVLEGDTFLAGFSVMNRTAERRDIEVKLTAEGRCASPDGATEKPSVSQTIAAEPYKRYTVRLPLKAAGPGDIRLTAQAGDERDKDSMHHTLLVYAQRSPQVSAAYGSIVTGEARQRIEFPDMRPGSGLLNVSLSPTILGGLGGAFDFMKSYPFECWEQKISRAVMAAAISKLSPYLPEQFQWEKSDAFAERILQTASEFQAPNGGMAFYLPRDACVSPFLSAYTALAFNWMRETGHEPPAPVEEKLHNYLLNLLKKDSADDAASRAILPNVRSIALSALADRKKITAADLERQRKHLPGLSLVGKAFFLEASAKIEPGAATQREVLQDILSHGDQTSGTIRFTESADSLLRSMLSSTARDNAAILLSLLAYKGANPAQTELGDIPAHLMRAVSASRRDRDHWASTQENVFAAMAALRYSQAYETQQPDIDFEALLDTQALGKGHFANPNDRPVAFRYNVQDSDRGRKADIGIRQQGPGRLYFETRLSYSPARPGDEAVNAGIEIHREYSVERDGKWVLLASPMDVRIGEVVRVDLFVSLPAERYFVVVEDPVPAGLEPVSRDLATASEADARKAEAPLPPDSFRHRFTDWRSYGVSRWSFYHRELRHKDARFYSERLGAGNYHLSYTAQAIVPGEFSAPPARAEEMYEPDVFGKSTPAVLKVQPAD
ncbi:MAG: hypothetical protein LLG06_18515 [Desulfobacteraceae bacterium]|nr:hypothetical protein [Desulfobacteraceae bacterium]